MYRIFVNTKKNVSLGSKSFRKIWHWNPYQVRILLLNQNIAHVSLTKREKRTFARGFLGLNFFIRLLTIPEHVLYSNTCLPFHRCYEELWHNIQNNCALSANDYNDNINPPSFSVTWQVSRYINRNLKKSKHRTFYWSIRNCNKYQQQERRCLFEFYFSLSWLLQPWQLHSTHVSNNLIHSTQ